MLMVLSDLRRQRVFLDGALHRRTRLPASADGPLRRPQAFELCGLPYYLDPEYAGIIGQLTHADRRSHSIDSFIQSDHLFHLDHRQSASSPSRLTES